MPSIQFPVSFNIITGGGADERIDQMIDSVEGQHLPISSYEIQIIGGSQSSIRRLHTTHVPFDETQRPGWITKKKNIATSKSRYDVNVYMHDYHVLDANWYLNLVQFGTDWDIQMHQILMINGYRMFDWLTYDHPSAPPHTPIPYNRNDLLKYQYISGGYWLAKRDVMIEEPQNEELGHHQAEDLDWSFRVRNKYKIVMNPACIVRHNKPHRENELQKHRMLELYGAI